MLRRVRAILDSPRRRRRVIRLSVLAAVVGAIATAGVVVGNTGRSFDTPLRNEAADVYVAPKSVPLTAAAIRAARLTAFRFVETAVRRDHVGDSWAITHPSFRHGYTKSEWAGGDIPVIPYPANMRLLRYQVMYSYANTLGMSLSLRPAEGSQDRPMVFGMELTKAGRGGDRAHWLVSRWTPVGLPGNGQVSTSAGTSALGPELNGNSALSTLWLVIPAMLLVGILAVPAAVLAGSWYRGRRAERAYLAERNLL